MCIVPTRRGYGVARDWLLTKQSSSSALLLSFSGIYFLLLYLSFCCFCVVFFYLFSCSHWRFIGVPFIFFCSVDHVPDWQPRILLGMVEARWIHVKNTTKTTTLDKQRKCFFASVCVFFCIVKHTLRLMSSDKILRTWNCVMGKL